MRAFAALSVVVFHINKSMNFYDLPNLRTIDLAGYGVTMFFAISGFLITYLLLLEKAKSPIDVKKFYIRRMLRIWPLYFLILGVSIITAYLYNIPRPEGSYLYYLLMLANIPFVFDFALPFLGHYWSLAVEEQFYLFWPLIVKIKGNLLKTVCVFTIVFFAIRLVFRFIEYKYGFVYPYAFINVNRFDCMSIGAIGGILLYQNNEFFLKLAKHIVTQLICLSIVLLMFFNKYHTASVIDQEIIALVTVFIMINVSSNPKSLIKLEWQLFEFLGKCSFGIYVVHQLVIFYFSKVLNSFEISSNYKYPLIYIGVISITIFISYISYKYFERPFLKLKEKFSIIKSVSYVSKEKKEV